MELATLLTTSVETLLPLPRLADWDEPVEADDTCSATSILPPNWKVLSLTWVLFFENVAVSHEHASAATLLTTSLSGEVETVCPWVTVAPWERPEMVALPREGSPEPVELTARAHWQTGTTTTTGVPPGVVGVVVMVQLEGKP